jgi:hypothetical protein
MRQTGHGFCAQTVRKIFSVFPNTSCHMIATSFMRFPHLVMKRLHHRKSYVPVFMGIAGVLGPMRTRRWIGVLAILGVLLHAGFLVRHNNSVLLTSILDTFTLNVNALCHVGPTDPQPNIPAPNNTKCPICAGAAPAVASLGIGIPAIETSDTFVPTPAFESETYAGTIPAVCPPSRAPPALA